MKMPDRRNIMIDCGSDSEDNVYENNVLPYMNYKGIYKIDIAVITHFHSDHVNGIIPMLEDKKIKTLILPDRLTAADEEDFCNEIIAAAIENDVHILFAAEGDEIAAGENFSLTVISPDHRDRRTANEASLVIKLNCFDTKVLLTGDIEILTQYSLINRDIKADILKIPHHGGYVSTSESFAKKADCEYAVISCGENNPYSHPHSKILDIYSDAKILRTDKDKTIEFVIDKEGEHYAEN